MRNTVENKHGMYYAVKEYFTNHLATLDPAATKTITTIVGTHNILLTELDAILDVTEGNYTGYTTQKAVDRATMQTKTLAIAGALYAYFKINKNHKDAAAAYTTPSGLSGKTDSEVFVYCRRIQKLAAANVAPLEANDISEAYIESQQDDIDTFEAVMQEPKDKRSEVKAANQYIWTKIDEIDDNLTIIDALMQAAQPQHPLLYLQYRAVRLIDDNGSGHSVPDIIEPIEANTIELLYTADYEPGRTFKLKNTGSADIQWTLSDSDTEATNDYHTLAGGATSTLQSDTIAPSGNFLLINNPNDEDIIVELTVTE